MERKLGKFRTVSSTSRNRLSFRISECENVRSVEDQKPSIPKSEVSSQDSTNDENGSVISSETSSKKVPKEKSIPSSHIEIKQESVNYLGYYSSHEQLMQQLILDCANSTQKKIGDMVMQGKIRTKDINTVLFSYLWQAWYIAVRTYCGINYYPIKNVIN